MKKRTRIILISTAATLSFTAILLWALINLVFIPKIVVPKIHEHIDNYTDDTVKLSIGDISFHPFKGFLLEDLRFSGPVALNDNYIFHAKFIDIDMAFVPLLWKKIEVKHLLLSGVDLNIGRDTEGEWNFQPLLDLDFMSEKDVGKSKFSFVIKKVKVEECNIDYADYHIKDNSLQRRFHNVGLNLTNPTGSLYMLKLCGEAEDRTKGSIDLSLSFNIKKKTIKGDVLFNTEYLTEYWDYYLDDILNPWHLKAEDIDLDMKFSYKHGVLSLKGGYTIKNGTLGYGDLYIKGNAAVKQKLELTKGQPDKDVIWVNLSLKDITSLTGEHMFLNKGKCTAVITDKAVTIKELSGETNQRPVNLAGKFTFAHPKELYLTGNIGRIKNKITAKITSETEAQADWQGSINDSYIKIHADTSDLKDLAFNLNIESNISLPDLMKDEMKDKIKGTVSLLGNVGGEADKLNSLNGKLPVSVKDLSIFDLEPITFNSEIDITNGLFAGDIPEIDFYKGKLYAYTQMDFSRWAAELHIDNLDLEEFSKYDPKVEGILGAFTGNIACISSWADLNTVNGGGFFSFIDCDLWKAPILSDTEESIEEATEKMDMPKLEKLEGNFELKKENIDIENVFCKASNLNLQIKGKIYFSGAVDLTVGVLFSKGTIFRTVRQVLVPVTIGIDLLANSFKVDVTGTLPDVDTSLGIQPAGWFNAFFPSVSHAKPDKYTLKKLWTGEEKDTKKSGRSCNYNQRRKKTKTR